MPETKSEFSYKSNPGLHPGDEVAYYVHQCGQRAREERERPECTRCESWSGCGSRNCTLSALVCDMCDARQEWPW